MGPALFGYFGFVHLFSFLVLYSVSAAYFEACKGNIQKHQAHMMGVYFGGVLVAGVFTFLPGRLLHDWVIMPFIGYLKLNASWIHKGFRNCCAHLFLFDF